MKVTLRREKISKGKESLYFDVYIDKNNQYQKRLRLHLIPAKSNADKERNKQILRIAELRRNELESELLNKKFGQHDPRQDYNFSFIEYFDTLIAQRYETGINYDTWRSLKKHLYNYTKKKMGFDELNETWMNGFKAYLCTKVSQNSAHSYFNVLKGIIHTAFRQKLIDYDPAFNVKSPKIVTPNREYLTEDELISLTKVECRYPVMKKAFLFSALTGLRWSDVNNLKWGYVIEEGDDYHLKYTQRKTKEAERLPINSEARKLMGERKQPEDRVFVGLKYSDYMNVALLQWVLKAGITKHITFHCARHTHATLLLNKGVDIYTVSKMLGHSDIKTTQIYAKLVNETKVKAVEKLPSIL